MKHSARRRRRPSARALAVMVTVGITVLVALAGAGIVNGTPAITRHAVAQATTTAAVNPLDPLTVDEINTMFDVIEHSNKFPAGAYFPFVKLKDPAKSTVLAWSPGQPFARQAFAQVYDPTGNHLYEAVVDLRTNKLVSWVPRPGVQPAIYTTEYATSDEVIRAYTPWRLAMKKRGVDPDDVYLDVWAPGDLPSANAAPGARLMRARSFYKGDLPNPYDRPIEGVIVTVDMNKRKVIDLVDTGVRPVNTTVSGNADSQRTGLQPLAIRQPDGPSFQIDGREVTWQNWHFRVDYTMREGIVLHQIGYEQNGLVRPVIYRLSLDDIFVPYALPDVNWVITAAFDVGEYNYAQYAKSLVKNVDVPENAVFLDEVMPSDTGSVDGAFELPHAVAVWEQDASSLWERTDPTTLDVDARFGRELVVMTMYPFGNYTYTLSYIFKMNGAIDVRVGSTGTTLNRGVNSLAEGDQYGANVEQGIAAPAHQHFFNFRIDFDVDGVNNRLVEEHTSSAPSSFGNAFVTQGTLLGSEQSRDVNLVSNRRWVIESTNKVNRFGDPTAYELVPGETAVPYASPSFKPLQRAPFAQHPLWVTRFSEGELYAAGDYPNQGNVGEGLTAYTSSPESVSAKDLVVWYSAGFTHVPEPEDYPVMTTEIIGFELLPSGFFDRNPALDAPEQR